MIGVALTLHAVWSTPARKPIAVCLCMVAAAMLVRCVVRNAEWRDNETLYRAAYRAQPDGVGARYLYGQWLVAHGEVERGIALLHQAIEVDLGYTLAHRALGQAYAKVGRFEAALRHLQTANHQSPNHPATVAALDDVVKRLEMTDRSLEALRQRASDRPADVGAQLALLRRLRELGLLEEARERFSLGESQFESNAEWQLEYAVTLVLLGRVDDAIERYRVALLIDPANAQAAVELAMLLLERRREQDLAEAWTWAELAESAGGVTPNVLVCQAEILAARGDLSGALERFQRVLDMLPPDSAQRRIFEQRAKTLGLKP
jgi:tetratricopeptide (TPR) repeat protein